MNRSLTSVGLLIALAGAFLFYGVFANVTPGFTSFLAALVLLPIGSGMLFYGAAFRGSFSAHAAAPGGGGAPSGTVWAAVAVAVVAILLSIGSLSVAMSAQSSANAVSGQISQVSAGLTANLASSGIKPSTVAFKVDWCNTDNTGEDRYCPNELVVNQGDTVQIMFLHNDTDVHTFTFTTGYSFQINASFTGMHDFLNNGSLAGPCSNAGAYSQESAGVSGIYCVSGTSLLPPSGNFQIAQNPTPASPGGPGGLQLTLVKMDNTVHVVNFNFSAGISEVWGVGSFQATTPGIYEFFCHYHVSNGMFGYLIVLPNPYCTANAAACGTKS